MEKLRISQRFPDMPVRTISSWLTSSSTSTHSMATATSRTIGCYTGIHEGGPHVQPAAFVLDESGNIVHAVYSSGMVGRRTAEDALTLLRNQQKLRAKAAT